jgi:hypothetical protein
MAGAMIVLVVLILGWVGFRALTSREPADPVQTVDYQREVPVAKKTATFDLLAPPSLPAGWRATTVNFADAPDQHWHLGVLTNRGRYVGLEQGDQPVMDLVHKYVDDAPERGRPVDVSGARWSTYSDAGGDTALVRRSGATTTLVVGHDVPRSDLISYTSSLR